MIPHFIPLVNPTVSFLRISAAEILSTLALRPPRLPVVSSPSCLALLDGRPLIPRPLTQWPVPIEINLVMRRFQQLLSLNLQMLRYPDIPNREHLS
jgi:hypothetical protein